MSYEQWDLVIGINVMGVINGIQTFVPRMLQRGTGGYVVNTASGAGLLAGTNALYSTSKFAVVGLSEALKLQGAKHGIDVSVLCPAYVDTNIVATTAAAAGDISIGQTATMAQETVDNLKGGRTIDEVGEIVLAGMEAKATWIFTDGMLAPFFQMRTDAMLQTIAPFVEQEKSSS
jgi:NAD(P)-dependent dehydrogenase (short-subunit alcohol dehydrogenase family)